MNLGEVREAVGLPKIGGVLETARLSDDRKIVARFSLGEDKWGFTRWEYRAIEAVGTLFFEGEFTVIIEAGEVV